MTLLYKRQIEVSFDGAAFGPSCSTALDIQRSAVDRDTVAKLINPDHVNTLEQFYMGCIRFQVATRQQQHPVPTLGDLLRVVQTGWDSATALTTKVVRLGLAFPTLVKTGSLTSDGTELGSSVVIKSSLLLAPLRSRVEVTLVLSGGEDRNIASLHEPAMTISSSSKVVYGENFNPVRINDFLKAQIGTVVGQDGVADDWSGVLTELKGRLIARGRR